MIKLGILNALAAEDSIDGITEPMLFRALLQPFADQIETVTYDVCQGHFPPAVDSCDAYLITGSAQSAFEDIEWIHRLTTFVQAVFHGGGKLVGICFGHQLISQALGGRVERWHKGWGLGLQQFQLTDSSDKPKDCKLYFAHQDQVTQLPPNAKLIASSAETPHILYTIADQVYSLQAHPELTPPVMQRVIDKFSADIPTATLARAAQSLQTQPDNADFAQHIAAFLLKETDENV